MGTNVLIQVYYVYVQGKITPPGNILDMLKKCRLSHMCRKQNLKRQHWIMFPKTTTSWMLSDGQQPHAISVCNVCDCMLNTHTSVGIRCDRMPCCKSVSVTIKARSKHPMPRFTYSFAVLMQLSSIHCTTDFQNGTRWVDGIRFIRTKHAPAAKASFREKILEEMRLVSWIPRKRKRYFLPIA